MKSFHFQDSVAAGTSVLTFIAPKICCWNGAIAAISSGTSYLAWVYPLRPYLFALAFISLGFSFYRKYRPIKMDSNGCASCSEEKMGFFRSKLWLWIVSAFVILTFSINYITT